MPDRLDDYLRTAAPPHAHSTALGLYVSIYYGGGAVGGILPAAAWRVGGWTACVALVALVQIATIALVRLAWRPAEAEPRSFEQVGRDRLRPG